MTKLVQLIMKSWRSRMTKLEELQKACDEAREAYNEACEAYYEAYDAYNEETMQVEKQDEA